MPECRPGAGCKSARGHRTRPREPGMPPRPRPIGRDSKLYTDVNETVTNSFRPSLAFFTTLLSSQTHSAFAVHQTSQSKILLRWMHSGDRAAYSGDAKRSHRSVMC